MLRLISFLHHPSPPAFRYPVLHSIPYFLTARTTHSIHSPRKPILSSALHLAAVFLPLRHKPSFLKRQKSHLHLSTAKAHPNLHPHPPLRITKVQTYRSCSTSWTASRAGAGTTVRKTYQNCTKPKKKNKTCLPAGRTATGAARRCSRSSIC